MFFCLALFLATSLSITITDAQHAVIPAARVAVYRQTGPAYYRVTTNEAGTASLELSDGGTYIVDVEAQGFRRSSRTISIASGQSAREDFSLEVAGVDSSIVVTSSDFPQTADDITKALDVVDSREILDRGEYSLAGILSTMPGVLVHHNGGPGQPSTLRVRGLRPDSSAILIDGMRFRDAASAQGDSSQFFANLNFIAADRVEVLRGSASSLYGTNATSGVANIITDPGGGVLHGTVQAEGGSLGFFRGRTQIGGGALADRLKFTAGFTHLNVTRGIDGNDRTRSSGVQGTVNADLTPRTTVSGRFFGSDDFMQVNVFPAASGVPVTDIPGQGVVQAIAGSTYFSGRDDPDDRRSSRFHSTAFKLQHILSASSSLQASYQRVHTSRIYINGPGGLGFQPAVSDYSHYVGDIDTADVRSNVRILDWNLLTAGYEFERERYADVVDNNLPSTSRLRTQTTIRQTSGSVYFQNQSGLLGKRLQISLSGRMQFFSLNRPEFQARGVTSAYDAIRLVSPPKAITGDVSFSYLVGDSGTKFRAHGGNAYRAPSLFERFGAGFFIDFLSQAIVFTPYGDPSLSPDRYNSIDGGIDQYLWRDRVRISGTYFYTRVVTITAFDLGTVVRPATDRFGRSFGYINGSGGLSRGVEISARIQPSRVYTVSGSYTYTNAAMDRDISVQGFRRVLGVPRHVASVVATGQIGRRVTIATDISAGSEMFGNFTAGGRARAYRFPGFAKVDLSGSIMLAESDRKSLKFNTRVENFLNRKYYDLGWRVPGAVAVAGLQYQF
jgi:vitamin B12 transporter